MAESKKGLLSDFIKSSEYKTKEIKTNPVSLITLFRFADFWDKLFMILGSICSLGVGICIPLLVLVFGDIIDAFAGDAREQAMMKHFMNISMEDCSQRQEANDIIEVLTGETLMESIVTLMQKFSLQYVYIGIGVIFSCWAQITFWMLAAERQCHKMRMAFFRSVLYQTIGWFDERQAAELNIRLTDDITKIQTGIGDKIGISLQWISAGVASFALGINEGWQLSLVILAFCPLIGAGAFTMSKFVASLSNTESAAYSKAGTIAEEVLSNIRTVVAYGGEKKESLRYAKNLDAALKAGVKKSAFAGLGMGFTYLVVFAAYCLGFWYGAKLIRESQQICFDQCVDAMKNVHEFSDANELRNAKNICKCPDAVYTPGVLVTVFFSIIFGAFGFGQLFPNFASLAISRTLARNIFDIIDHKSSIDASKDVGNRIPDGESFDIKFSNVHFAYPARTDVEVLRGLDLDIKIGETLALVGTSGCGKSTVVQLLQRFYDSNEGNISMGEYQLQSLNVRWLREQIGVVSQEPVLFATTIAENIRYGHLDVTDEEIRRAAKHANAHDFIKKLPKHYDTIVGDRGAQLSGGQKQRIAIARALVRNPKILLLDEATSALDTESEAVVQEALDKACQGRTTVIIAHRLSTIQNADRIAVIRDGRVVEIGNHANLMSKECIYHRMVLAQRLGEEFVESGSREKYVPTQRLSSKVSVVSQKRLSEIVIEEEKLPEVGLRRILRMNSPEWFFILLGCLSAVGNGAVQPAFAVIFAEFMNVFTIVNLQDQESRALLYSFGFLFIGIFDFIVNFLQSLMFGISGEHLTKRLRRLSFEAMLRQEIGWFDDPRNSTGALTTRLASETSSVNGATGVRLGVLMQAVGSMGIGLALAFGHGWKMSLIVMAFAPFIIIGGAAQMKLMVGFSAQATQNLLNCGKTACEAIDNIRTVVSLGREKEFLTTYVNEMTPTHRKECNKAIIYGLAYGFSQGVVYFSYAASLYYGATQVQSCEMTFVQVLKVFGCIFFSAMAVGQASSFAPDYGKAKVAATEIFSLLDRKPAIEDSCAEGTHLEDIKGAVTFYDVGFRYPSRPDVDVLQNFSIYVPAGKTLALVGSSGCGKSTCIQLLERFYDTLSGKVMLENVDVKSMSVSWVRAQFGLVSQEPSLFDCTIRENIAYGDNSRNVQMDEIIDAARQANIHEFIVSLPQGYETRVGDRGGQLSGGQKQRIAIARALIRRPKILLLDEATSALDSESEKVVQVALDIARQKRTCIIIAHRLSTIQNADSIAVITAGRVAEYGTHSELLSRQGLYFRLHKAQNRP